MEVDPEADLLESKPIDDLKQPVGAGEDDCVGGSREPNGDGD